MYNIDLLENGKAIINSAPIPIWTYLIFRKMWLMFFAPGRERNRKGLPTRRSRLGLIHTILPGTCLALPRVFTYTDTRRAWLLSYQFSISFYSSHDSYSMIKIHALNESKHNSPSAYFFVIMYHTRYLQNIIENWC